jgi:hypothetical protein
LDAEAKAKASKKLDAEAKAKASKKLDAEAKAEASKKFFSDGNLPESRVGCKCGSSSVGRATAFQAVGRGFEPRLPLKSHRLRNRLRIGDSTSRCSSGVEHFLGKEEVVSSILINGSIIIFVG